MKERISERINTYIDAKLFCRNELRSGIIKNLSETDMYIESEMCYPVHSQLEVLIPSMREIIIVSVEICRIQAGVNHLAGIGLQLKKCNDNYLNLVNKHNTALFYCSIN